ncbi:hypothetical protein ACFWHE_27085, partial [Streptomyces hydrogenans]
MNEHLRPMGIELRQSGHLDGYPRFALVPLQFAHARAPKNVVFGTPSKPDIRFLSAVGNDVEVVNGNALIYDRTVTDDGIRRRDLRSWWQEREHLTDPNEATESLCARLRAGLPDNSPGRRIVLEVDGSQHYTRDRGRTPDTVKYAAVVAADRDLRLSGHEVYRFGHDELRDGTEG